MNINRAETARMRSPFLCNLCNKDVRCGTITICGHLFCWPCLWPILNASPQCPRCARRLVLHEDIIPMMSNGTNDTTDNDICGQPGNVARPSGIYLASNNYPIWFLLNGSMDAQNTYELRSFANLIHKMKTSYPKTKFLINALKWLQVQCIIAIVVVYLCFSIDHDKLMRMGT